MPGSPDPERGLWSAQAALDYARTAHAGQRLVDGSPFIGHPLEVASLLRGAGAAEHVIIAGALHDVLEKTPVGPRELRSRFGRRVTALVVAVTEDECVPGYARRKAALRRQVGDAGDEALTVFAADKVSRARELRPARGEDSAPGTALPGSSSRGVPSWDQRLAHYGRCLTLLQHRLPHSPLVDALAAELGQLASEQRVPRVTASAA